MYRCKTTPTSTLSHVYCTSLREKSPEYFLFLEYQRGGRYFGKNFHLTWKNQLCRVRRRPRAPRLPAAVIRRHRRVASGAIVWNFCCPASVCRWDWEMSGDFRISRTLMGEAGWRKIGQTFSLKIPKITQCNEWLFALIDWLVDFRRVSHSVHLRAVFGRQTHVFYGGNEFKVSKKQINTGKSRKMVKFFD